MHSTRIAGALLALMVCTAGFADSLTPALKIGDPAPPLRPLTWIKGEPVQRFEPGRVYVVEFWAVECVPCRELMPELSTLQKQYADRLTVIGVNVRNGGLTQVPAKVEKFVKNQGARMDYTVAMDDPQKNTIFESWGTASCAYGIPTAIIVDGRGRMVWVGNPHGKGNQAFNTAVEQALAGKSDLAAAQMNQNKLCEQAVKKDKAMAKEKAALAFPQEK